MGFLSKAFKRVKKQIQPDNMMIGNMRNMPKRGGGFLSRLRGRKPEMINDMRFRGEMPRDGGMGGLGEAIRRLQEQGQFGVPRGSRDPSTLESMQRTPQPIPEQMPTDPSSYYNPTIFGQQMGNMDFSQMPKISPVDMSNLQMPTLPREISQMDLPQMPEGLPSMQDVQGGRSFNFADYKPQDRMMMARGDVAEKETLMDFLTKDRRGRKPGNAFSLGKDIYDFANQPEPSTQMSPEQEIFSLQTQLKNLEEQLRMDRSYNDDQAVIDTSAQMAAIQNRIKELLQESGQTISNTDRLNESGTSISRERQELLQRAQLSGGGDFPDLTGDGQVTQADILKGRGVYAEGGEIEAMLSGMDSGEEEAMGELEQMAPEMEMIDQLVNMVVQMIQQGASEEEVIMFLREQGLDDEDIGTVLQLVSEMAETEEMAAQNEIGADLEQLG